MRIGIDFGTTRVVVAAADRGTYPVVTFDSDDGEGREWLPSLLVARRGELLTGLTAAAAAHAADARLCRSLKRELTAAGPRDRLLDWPVPELAARFLTDLHQALRHRSNLRLGADEPLEAAVAVPANATANQRLLTADAFRDAGFRVVRIMDEPSAAGLEYAWRRPKDAQVKSRHVAVYDLGGGTFDASVIAMSDALHEVITTEGLQRLGGDDFDAVLLGLACDRAGLAEPAPGPGRDRWLEVCREEKERMGPHTRRLSLELAPEGPPVEVPAAVFEEALRPLVARTLEALDLALGRVADAIGRDVERNTVVYQVGGASMLASVGRALKERFGRRVWRSPYPHASVAIGLAIAAAEELGPAVVGRLTRTFGVWREGDAGRNAVFDPVFGKDLPLPAPGEPPLLACRRYRAAHNVAHFRFVECSRLSPHGAPAGDVTPWAEVRFPVAPELRGQDLDRLQVVRLPAVGDEVEERYRCDADGVVSVEIANLSAGYGERYALHGRAG